MCIKCNKLETYPNNNKTHMIHPVYTKLKTPHMHKNTPTLSNKISKSEWIFLISLYIRSCVCVDQIEFFFFFLQNMDFQILQAVNC